MIWLSLAATLLAEAVLGLLFPLRRQLVPAGLALNLTTHPLACLALLRGADFWGVELVVLLAEVLGYRALTDSSWRGALGVALSCNGATLALSLLWSA
jgi:hypothetical protein